jgi:hypothetical protein
MRNLILRKAGLTSGSAARIHTDHVTGFRFGREDKYLNARPDPSGAPVYSLVDYFPLLVYTTERRRAAAPSMFCPITVSAYTLRVSHATLAGCGTDDDGLWDLGWILSPSGSRTADRSQPPVVATSHRPSASGMKIGCHPVQHRHPRRSAGHPAPHCHEAREVAVDARDPRQGP